MQSLAESPGKTRSLSVVTGVLLGLVMSVWALLSVLRETSAVILGPGRTAVDELVTAISAAAALALLVWVALGLLVSVLAVIPGPWGALTASVQDHVAPAAVRRWAALLLGAAIASTITPAGATATLPVSSVSTPAAPAPGWSTLDEVSRSGSAAPAPDWTPAPTRDLPPVSLTTPRQSADPAQHEVTVRRGDTLWDLAAAHLPAEATDAEIATSWQQWYVTNRAVIGPDPDLILPGQVLTVPADESATEQVSP